MFGFRIIAALLGLVALPMAAALPQTGIDTPTTGGVGPLVPTEIEIMYYQAPWEPNSMGCGTMVSNGSLEANTCTPLCTVGISIPQIPEADCMLTVYKGTQTCTNPTEIVSYAIKAGDAGMVCIDVGVFHSCEGIMAGGQGGASGMWACG